MKIFYIDSQSYNNPARYDKCLLENIPCEKFFYCSVNLQYDNIDNTVINRLYDYSNYGGIKKFVHYIFSQKEMYNTVLQEKPDIIHIQWFKIPIVDIFFLKKIKRLFPKIKIIYTAHNVLPHNTGSKFYLDYKKIYNIVDHIIVHTNVSKNEIIENFSISKDKITVIPHGFIPLWMPIQDKKKRNNIFTFSLIGELSEYKGVDLVIDAWLNNPKLLDNKAIKLVLAGKGEMDCFCKIPCNKNIVLENFFHSDEELGSIISNTDVAILPYRNISQSGVLLTMLAEHIPVVVSNVGGLTQPFEIGKCGWILDEINAESLSKTILSIIQNQEEFLSIKNNQNMWNDLADFYDWKNIGNMTFQLYKSLQ